MSGTSGKLDYALQKKPVNQKRVIQKDFQGRVIREFESISEAGRFHNVNPQKN